MQNFRVKHKRYFIVIYAGTDVKLIILVPIEMSRFAGT